MRSGCARISIRCTGIRAVEQRAGWVSCRHQLSNALSIPLPRTLLPNTPRLVLPFSEAVRIGHDIDNRFAQAIRADLFQYKPVATVAYPITTIRGLNDP